MITTLLFSCYNKTKIESAGQQQLSVELSAVYPNAETHKELYEAAKVYWKYTPSGKLVFQTLNEGAYETLIPGKLYKITIEEA